METRLLFISNKHRAVDINHCYHLENGSVRKGDYLFLLDKLSNEQVNDLKKAEKLFHPLIRIVYQDESKIVIKVIAEQDLLCSVQKATFDDSQVIFFFNKLVNYFTPGQKKCWKIGQSTLDFRQSPIIMGILNVTPDSFSDGGNFFDRQHAIEHGLQMVEAGVDIIDIGGESTRPGADAVSVSQELERVIPVITGIRTHSRVIISIDTYKSRVAKESIQAGADIINDISGTVFDQKMKEVIEEKKCPVILMHIKGTPKNMQENPQYNDLHEEVYRFFEKKIVELGALNKEKIIIDPGIGFGKSVSDNLKLLRDIKDFTFLDKPILIGTSRKSFLGRIVEKDVDERIFGSLASEIYSFLNGADILRVHDIKETIQVKKVINRILVA